jgi:hypothetical protein
MKNLFKFKNLMFIGLFAIFGFGSVAADTLTVGWPETSTYGYAQPYYYYRKNIAEFIITREEMGNKGAMYLKQMAFNVVSLYNSGQKRFERFYIYIKHTNANTLTAPGYQTFYPHKDMTGYQLVYTAGPQPPHIVLNKSVGSWVEWDFQTDFIYNGRDNIQVCLIGEWDVDYAYDQGGYGYYYFYTFSTGSGRYQWYYGYANTSSNYSYAYEYKPYTRFVYEQGPEIADVYPSTDHEFKLGELYDQASPSITRAEIPGFKVDMSNTPAYYPPIKATYTITGPYDFDNDIVYRAQDPATLNYYLVFDKSNADAQGMVTINIPRATGPYVWTGDNKSLDFRGSSVITGTYKAKLRIEPMSESPLYKGKSFNAERTFFLRANNDIAATTITSPSIYYQTVYPMENMTVGLDLQASIMNNGFNPIDSFYAQLTIYKVDFDELTQTVSNAVKITDAPVQPYKHVFSTPLLTGETFHLTENHLGTFLPTEVGYYEIELKTWFADTNIVDQELTNNTYPVIGRRRHLFRTALNLDPEIMSVTAPEMDYQYALGRIVTPVMEIINHGVTDFESADGLNLRVTIDGESYPGSGVYNKRVFDNTFIVDVLQANSVPRRIMSVDNNIVNNPPKGWLIDSYGRFKVTAEIIWPNHIIPADRRIKHTYFNVIPGLAGTYRIGKNQTYETIGEATRALYRFGVSAPVTFELVDKYYDEGTLDLTEKEIINIVSEDRTAELYKAYQPAIDLRSRIVGVCDTLSDGTIKINPITFKPSFENSKEKGSVTVNLRSRAGIGFMIGPCDTPSVKEAIVLEATYQQKRIWGVPDGYINFDGGEQKSLRFTLETGGSEFRAPFYLNSVSNCSIKNCIIEDGLKQERSYQFNLPGTTYNGAVLIWGSDYEAGATPENNYTYSTGVLVRTTPPYQFSYSSNGYMFDTVYCNNIDISNNEISKFTYGITSIGWGINLQENFLVDIKDTTYNVALAELKSDAKLNFVVETINNLGSERERVNTFIIRNTQTNRGYLYRKHYEFIDNTTGNTLRSFVVDIDSAFGGYGRAYNYNNNYSNNLIYDVGRAGIFVGYEENSTISNNRIHGIHGIVKLPTGEVVDIDCAGILMGGAQRPERFSGFNNIGLKITGNEISNIRSKGSASGIHYEQTLLYDIIMGSSFPDRPERTHIYNNIIWGIQAKSNTTNRYGINVGLTRPYGENIKQSDFPYYVVEDLKYNMEEFNISNNTIILEEDDYLDSHGEYMGLRLQHLRNSTIVNNAIHLGDKTFDKEKTNLANVIYYQGASPSEANNNINYNVYYWDTTSVIDAYRFVNTDYATGTVLDTGYVGEYHSLEQWQNWLVSDYYSSCIDFYNDYIKTDERFPKLRVKQDPVPVNSPLDNRGVIIDAFRNDIDGKLRGIGDQKYDIGAEEINSTRYSLDLELVNFAAPATYKASHGPFKDAEYHMIDSKPITAKIRVRNNGDATLTNRTLTMKIYRESPTINNFNANLHNNNFNIEYYNNELLHNRDQTIFRDIDNNNLVATFTKQFTLSAGDVFELEFPTEWIPETYKELKRLNLNYEVPIHFSRMENNVTPRYKFVIEAQAAEDEDLSNNRIEKIVRYYVKKSNIDLMITASNTYNLINHFENGKYVPNDMVTNMDMVAGRLNLDSLLSGFKKIGIEPISAENEAIPVYGVDILDRKAWDYRNVDYTLYRSLFISDELNIDTVLWKANHYDLVDRTFRDKYFIRDLEKFFKQNKSNSGTGKINLVLASENFVSDAKTDISFLRLNQAEKLDFIKNRLHTDLRPVIVEPEQDAKLTFFMSPLYRIDKIKDPASLPVYKDSIWVQTKLSYNDYSVSGLALGRNETNKIVSTGWENKTRRDAEPFGIIYRQDEHIKGFSVIGHVYDTIKAEQSMVNIRNENKIMSIASSNMTENVVLLGFDWRHYEDASKILRSVNDFIRYNNGDIVPVNLYGFEAIAYNNKVELNWNTASEINTERFEIERALLNTNYDTEYVKIGEVKAKGNSIVDLSYTAQDNRVVLGNTYSYRLKIVDADGSYSYSDTREVTIGSMELSIGEMTPNPANNETRLNINLPTEASVKVQICDISGYTVASNVYELTSGSNVITLNVNKLSSGTYTVLINIDGKVTMRKLNVVN